MKTINANLEYNSPSTIETSYDYWQAVSCVCDSVIDIVNEELARGDLDFDKDSIEDFINDSCLHEALDNSQYVMYNRYSLPIIQYSPNDEYAVDNFGGEELVASLRQGGVSSLHTTMAFWALYADVQEKIDDILNETDFDIEEDSDEETEED